MIHLKPMLYVFLNETSRRAIDYIKKKMKPRLGKIKNDTTTVGLIGPSTRTELKLNKNILQCDMVQLENSTEIGLMYI